MVKFKIRIAEICVKIESMYESTQDFCREYICENIEPDITITIFPNDIDYERAKSEKEDILEGIPVRRFSDAYLETLAVYRKICTELLKRDTLLFHGSVIAVDGEGYLFTAKSGTGKSTHTSIWRKMFGDRAIMINDDKPLIAVGENGVTV